MATTANQALPYQTLSDPPHGPDLGRLLALALEPKLVQRFASAADRAAKVPVPTIGQVSWLDDVQRLEIYTTTPAAGWYPIGFARPYARVYASVGLTAQPRNTNIKVPINTASIDLWGGLNVANNRFIFPKVGWYEVSYSLRMTNLSGTTQPCYAEAWIAKNGNTANKYANSSLPVAAVNQVAAPSATDVIQATAITDYVELWVLYTANVGGAAFDVPVIAGINPFITIKQIA